MYCILLRPFNGKLKAGQLAPRVVESFSKPLRHRLVQQEDVLPLIATLQQHPLIIVFLRGFLGQRQGNGLLVPQSRCQLQRTHVETIDEPFPVISMTSMSRQKASEFLQHVLPGVVGHCEVVRASRMKKVPSSVKCALRSSRDRVRVTWWVQVTM